ncbi:DNRLRE domain-containing protein [Paenibacillus albicereus]|uniref:DNRLRE domain-containing protein n=1 Tax=Paenibacillus albicereus TaxID=2726185 RepID=A0A6H2GYT6_9BACL|nr:S-layer homology domain-containing protein [Paenibacillus albicereus]QJC52509.1 DNRLRE domain-containing protein [Paenibacillus albicereus]
MRKSSIWLLSVLLLSSALPYQAGKAEAAGMNQEFAAVADTNEEDGMMYGTEPEMYIGRLLTPGDNIDAVQRSAVRFNMSAVTGSITQATLKLFVNYDSQNPNQKIEVWGSADNAFTDVDGPGRLPAYDSSDSSAGNYKLYQGPIADGAYISIDVTEIVKRFADVKTHSDDNVTLVLTGTETPGIDSRISVAARENSARAPKLEVTTSINQAPSGSISIAGGATFTNSLSVALNPTGSDPDGDPLQMQFSNDGTTWSALQPLQPTTAWTLPAGDGIKTVYMRLHDGNDPSTVMSDTIVLDRTSPVVSGVSAGGIYATDRTITFSEGTAELDGVSFASGSTVTAEGSHALVVTDAAGNVTTVSFVLDKSKPTGTLSINGGAAATTTGSVLLSATGSDSLSSVDAMQLSSDGTSWSSWEPFATSKSYLLPAGDGPKTVYLRLRDAAGNVSDSISDTIELDTTPPVVAGVTEGGLYNAAPTVTFGEGTATLDGAPFASGSAAAGEGSHTLVVTDAAGNTATVTFFVDTAKPTGSVTINGGDAVTGEAQVTLSLAAADPGDAAASGLESMQLSLDGTTWSAAEPVAASKTVALPAGDGEKTVYVRYIDKAGNVSESISDTIELDTTPPVVAGVTEGGLYNAAPTVTFGEGTATLDGAPFASGSAAAGEGSHELVVTDAAGNTATVTFFVDTAKPTGSVTINGGDAATGEAQVTLALAAADPGDAAASGLESMQLSLDGTTWSAAEPVAASKTVALPAGDGEKTVYVRYIDKAGNVSESISDTIELDTTPPVVAGVTEGGLYNAAPTVTFGEGTATLDGAPFASGSAAAGEGSHELVVTDAAGNTATVTFFVDTAKPTGSVTINGGDAATGEAQVTLALAAADPGDAAASGLESMQLSLDGTTWSAAEPVAASKTVALPAGDGEKTVYVRYIDKAGNVSESISDTIELDTTPPVVAGVTEGGLYNAAPTVTFGEGTATLDGAPFASGSAAAGEGSHELVVTDAAGNTATVTFFVDTAKPTGSVTINGGDAATGEAQVTLALAAADPGDAAASGLESMQLSLDGTTWSAAEPVAASKTVALPAGDGEKTVYVRYIDKAGNVSESLSDTIELDTTPPVVSGVADKGVYDSAVSISFNEGTATLDGKSVDSGVKVDAWGSHTLIVTDRAGNRTTVVFTLQSPFVPSLPAQPLPAADAGAELNRLVQAFGSGEIRIAGERRTAIVTMSPLKIEGLLAGMAAGSVLSVPAAPGMDASTLALDGSSATLLASRNIRLSVETPAGAFAIPTAELKALLDRFGPDASPSEVQLRVELVQLAGERLPQPNASAGVELLSGGLEARVYAAYQGREIVADRFQLPMELLFALPAGVNSGRITTAVAFGPNGVLHHLPTRVTQKDGVYYAAATSYAGGLQGVVHHEVRFADTSGHWADSSIANMSSRLIVQGAPNGQFRPNAPVTRAEFTAMLVRAFGLWQPEGTGAFKDVGKSAWYKDSIASAMERGLAGGYGDGTFRPNAGITREEAFAMLGKAMRLAGMDGELSAEEAQQRLDGLGDASALKSWSRSAIALALKYGILKGDGGQIKPSRDLTRAETAVLIERLLQASRLIDGPPSA